MKSKHLPYVFFSIIILIFSACSEKETSTEEIKLWPEIDPFETGYLKVSDIHEIYYELCGNPEGVPVFVIHGGPGAGCTPYMRRFFNPQKYLVVLHDQRGCGRSKPVNEITDNNTEALIQDIEQLRLKLELDKIILFGGSWGSTLSLAYAEEYPDNIIALVLRGIYLATSEENANYYFTMKSFFPEEYQNCTDLIPCEIQDLSDSILVELYQNEEFLKTYARLDFKILQLFYDNDVLDEYFSSPGITKELKTMYSIYFHYIAHECFLYDDQILKELEKIRHLPVYIINGRYDMICPPRFAYKLHKYLPGSNLIITEKAGHVMNEIPTQTELLKAMKELEKLYDEKKN